MPITLPTKTPEEELYDRVVAIKWAVDYTLAVPTITRSGDGGPVKKPAPHLHIHQVPLIEPEPEGPLHGQLWSRLEIRTNLSTEILRWQYFLVLLSEIIGDTKAYRLDSGVLRGGQSKTWPGTIYVARQTAIQGNP
jgi:hypothetical protein